MASYGNNHIICQPSDEMKGTLGAPKRHLRSGEKNAVRILCFIISFDKMGNYFDRNLRVLREPFKGYVAGLAAEAEYRLLISMLDDEC